MARPRTPIGTFGDISYVKAAGGQFRARTRFRDDDGKARRVSATGTTKREGERNLKKVAADRASFRSSGELSADSSFTQLVDVWLADLDLEGKLAPSTRALYERNMRQLVMPVFEGYTLREITVSKVDQFIKRLATAKSYMAKQARTVLSLAFGLAVRYDAIQKNPVRDTARLRKPPAPARRDRPYPARRVRDHPLGPHHPKALPCNTRPRPGQARTSTKPGFMDPALGRRGAGGGQGQGDDMPRVATRRRTVCMDANRIMAPP